MATGRRRRAGARARAAASDALQHRDDGFTGNVCLKLLEGTIGSVLESLREQVLASPRGQLGGLLLRPSLDRLRRRLDPETYGGAYLLGLRGLVVIAHGNSSRGAIANAIRLAARGVEQDVVARLGERLAQVPGARRSGTAHAPARERMRQT